ncbi:heparinase II/III domain-containing protein [Thalassoroseus pseudoceratinae]|uniref:heparinase II/III domain-containing protein n=1 Tax=Thalassoroseus pseudoceratinae TaxID=2713176 RepID=UPI0014232874|nr:heparinase II/III family protein [Thalassoroseus pseudoceratinae]
MNACVRTDLISPPVAFSPKLRGYEQKRHTRPVWVGASHGKEDKLNIYLDYGGHQLLASGGRGSYAGGPFAAYTGSTRAYNTLIVDDGVQARIPYRVEIDGHSAEPRRFVTDDHFEYAEGVHTHGWFAPDPNDPLNPQIGNERSSSRASCSHSAGSIKSNSFACA